MRNDWRENMTTTYNTALETYNNWAKAIGIPEKKIGDVIYLYEMEDLYRAIMKKATGIETPPYYDVRIPAAEFFGWAPLHEIDSD